MKWGVRRYQDKSGRLTNAGKKRYSDNSTDKKLERVRKETMSKEKPGNDEFIIDGYRRPGLKLTDKQKRAIKIGAAAAAAGLAVYGAYKLGVFEKVSASMRQRQGLDPSTGFKMKPDMPFARSTDVRFVNPKFNIVPGHTQNCMFCTTAYDLRRRGFDVEAKPRSVGGPFTDICKWYKGVVIEKATAMRTDEETYSALCKDLISHGEGARGNLAGIYKGGTVGGHSIIWEVVNNKVKFMDAQVNKVYDNGFDALKWFDREHIIYARLDDCEINVEAIKEAVKNR